MVSIVSNINWLNNNIFLIYNNIHTLYIDENELKKEHDIIIFEPHDFLNIKLMTKKIYNIMNYTNVFSNLEKLIIIKEVSELSLTNLNYIKKTFHKKNIKVILLSNGESDDVLKVFDSDVSYLNVNVIYNMKYLNTYISKKNIILELKLKKYILEISENIISRINEIIDFIYEENIKKYKLKDYTDILNTLYKNINNEIKLYDITKKIFTEKTSSNDILNYYSLEKTHLPLIIQKNYYKYINKNYEDKTENLRLYMDISEQLSKSELINTFMIKKQKQNILGENLAYISCVYPSHKLYSPDNKNIKIKYTNVISRDSYMIRKHNTYYTFLRETNIKLFDNFIIKNDLNIILNQILSDDMSTKKIGFKKMNKLNISIDSINKLLSITENKLKENTSLSKIKNKLKREIKLT